MTPHSGALRTATPYLIATLLALLLPAASAQVAPVPDAPEVPELFAPAAPGFADEFFAPRDAYTLRSRSLLINPRFFTPLPAGTTRRVRLPLFADREYTVLLTQPENVGTPFVSWRGRIEGYTNGHFSAVFRDGSVFMRLSDGRGGAFDVRPTADGGHVVAEAQPGDHGTCGVNAPPAAAPKAANDQGPANLTPSAALTYVDVLMLYTVRARNDAGGHANIQARAQLNINDANWMYSRSGTQIQLRLVSTEEIAYDDSSQNLLQHQQRLSNLSDGFMDDVETRRNAYGADLVCLMALGRTPPELGWASTPGWASVVEATQDAAVFAHEFGHNFGCYHQVGAPNVPPEGYNHGYSHTESWNSGTSTEERRTVMHSTWSPDRRTDYFSNPSINFTFTGNECGGFCVNVDRPLGNAASADNARFLREVRADRAVLKPPFFYVNSTAGNGDATAGSPENDVASIYSLWFPRTEVFADESPSIRIAAGNTSSGARLDKKSRLEKWGDGGHARLIP